MTTIEDRRQVLAKRLAELEARLQGIEHTLDARHSDDWQERAIEREDDEVLESMGMSGQAEIRAIRAALDRIANGTYGQCQRCGEQISDERLDLLPFTQVCRDCAGARPH